MNDNVRNELCHMIQKHGQSLIDDPRRCKGLLSDLCVNDKREMNVLLGALNESVPNDLVTSQVRAAPWAHMERLTRKLQQNQSLAEEAARWAVESWALALGVVKAEALRGAAPNFQPSAVPPASVPPIIHGGHEPVRRESEPVVPVPIPDPPLWVWLWPIILVGIVVAALIHEFSSPK